MELSTRARASSAPEEPRADEPRSHVRRALPDMGGGRAQLVLAAVIVLVLAAIALHFDAKPRHWFLRPIPDALRVVGATVLGFTICGFGLVRLLLPDQLREYELLWVLPTGACALGLALTVVGFAQVPYAVSLPLVLVAGIVLGAYAVRSRGWPELPAARLAWPVLLASVIVAVAVIPMVAKLHYVAPTGTGSDAHVATGVAQFLKHSSPGGVDVSQPINQMQPTWNSKYPIYYAFAAVSTLSGLATWQVLAMLAAAMLGLAAVGLFLVARQVLGAPAAIAAAAMALAALDREALHTILNPYFNQTWGFFAMPFTLVLGWWVGQPGLSRRARVGGAVLFAIFGLVLVLAYPLAAPIPLVPLAVFAWAARRRRIASGARVWRLSDLYRGRRSLVWMVPVAVALALPVAAAIQKMASAAGVLLPGHSLANWAGDLQHFIPFYRFLSLPNSPASVVLVIAVLGLVAYGLARQPRALSLGLGGLLVLGLVVALYLRSRPYGQYFQFKLLAFVGPLFLLLAAVGAGRLRRYGVACIAALSLLSVGSAVAELQATGFQLGPTTVQLASWAKSLPKGASIRLDMAPPDQLWAAYFLASRPVCSERPLLGTDYPHVPISRKADYILAFITLGRPADAIGPPLQVNPTYRLYRENPSVPGVSHCSQRRQDRLYTGESYFPV